LEGLKGFSAERLDLSLVETVGIFVLHYVMNLSEFFGNMNYLAGNQFFQAFGPMPKLVGGLRPTQVLLPANYDPTVAAPLLLLLHGYSDDRYYTENLLKLRREASDRGFIYVIPNAIKNSVGERFWRATEACCDFLDMGWDDSKYLINLIDEVSFKFAVDQDRIFIAGHSNGGFMAHRMACEHASRIAGIVAYAGLNYKEKSFCKPSEPVNIL